MKESIKEHILSSKDLLFDFVLFCCTSGSRSSWRAILSGGPRIRKKKPSHCVVTLKRKRRHELKEAETTSLSNFHLLFSWCQV